MSVVATTTTLQIFSLTFFWSLPSNLHTSFPFFVNFTSFSVFLAQRHPIDHRLIHSPHRLFTWTWSSYRLSSFPMKIAHFWRVTNLPSRNCTILFGILLGSNIAQFFQSTLPARIAQFSPAGLLTPAFGKSGQQSAALPKNCANPLGSQHSSQLEIRIPSSSHAVSCMFN